MANITITRGNTLPDSSAKADFHNLIDQASAAITGIVNADVDGSAAIAGTKISPNFGAQTLTVNGVGITKFSTDGTMDDNSDAYLPTEKAVKTYVDAVPRTLTVGDRVDIISNCDGSGHQVTDNTMISITARYDAGAAVIVVYSDSASTPTTVVGKDRGATAYVSSLIKAGHYYKVVISATVDESIAYSQTLTIE